VQSLVSTLNGLTSLTFLLAQAAEGQAAPAAQNQGSPLSILPAVVGAVLLWWLLIMRPERRKQAAQRTQLETLKKNDRVVTVGGIYGIVMNVQRDSDEVVLKVDEANNTKLRVTFAAISRVIPEESSGEKPA
jgi:preprotein translocase subunit YajC